MFLFLSKLLPLFIYPLGLAFVLLTIALIFLRKRPGLARRCILGAMVILWLSSSTWGVKLVIGSLERPYARYSDPAGLPPVQAIVVLGGATGGAIAPRSLPEVNEAGDRVFRAAQLYQASKAPLIILSGGRIRWNPQGVPQASEAEDMATLLGMIKGLDPKNLILESESLNTYQNAMHVQRILKEKQIDRILLVTSAFHMPRALAIFRKLGIDTTPAPTDFHLVKDQEKPSFQQFLLDFLPTVDNLEKTSKGLKEYLGIVVYWLRGWL